MKKEKAGADAWCVWQGVVSTGGTLTTVNPHYTAEEMQKQLTHSNASIIFTIEEDLGSYHLCLVWC
jgi:long-subunit acyl-CoA synthetase (AMP-forming)